MRGSLVYQGQRVNAAAHFEQLGHPVPESMGELEHYIYTMSRQDTEE
jgi:hypothetical protein